MKLTDWISLACLGIALVILWRFRQIVLLIFAAVVLAIALNSLVRRFINRLDWKRGQAVLATMSIVWLSSLLVLVLVLPLFISQFQELLVLIPSGFEQLGQWFDAFNTNPPEWFPEPDIDLLPDFSTLLEQATSLGTRAFGNFFNFFSSSVAILLQMLLLAVLTLMILADPLAYRRLLLRLFPSFYRRRADHILARCEAALLNWLGGVAINSAFVATLSFTGLVLLGVPYAFAHAVLTGIFNFIPNIGPTLSVIFPVFVALLQSPGKALAVIVLYLLIQNLESYWFGPMMMQKQVALLPAATLIAQIFFATFLGPLGLILALPLAVICKVWIEEAWIIDVLEREEPAALVPAIPAADLPAISAAAPPAEDQLP
ncbi:MAG: AI-2E family transporter [Cyanobacteria bacterium Co-bin13]|nr:AI-2E family transporter [Cyanobacteria bacterium Co-bin13]